MANYLYKLILFSCLVAAIYPQTTTPLVQYVSNDPYNKQRSTSGSKEGGLILYVQGSGFKALSSQVMIGVTPCGGAGLVTKTRIVCEVPPLPIGIYNVTVLVPGPFGMQISECAVEDSC